MKNQLDHIVFCLVYRYSIMCLTQWTICICCVKWRVAVEASCDRDDWKLYTVDSSLMCL